MKQSAWWKLGFFILLVVGLWWGMKAVGYDVTQLTPEKVRRFVLSFGAWAPVIYLAVYGQPIVPLPASVMTMAAGLVFGLRWGACMAVTGAMTRACTEFMTARWLGREAVAHLLKGHTAELDKRIAANGFKAVLLIRLIPSLPFDVLNYGLGFSPVRFGPYALASLLGLLPWNIAFVYFGHSLTDSKHLWKLFAAMFVIVGLTVAQHLWKRRHPVMEG